MSNLYKISFILVLIFNKKLNHLNSFAHPNNIFVYKYFLMDIGSAIAVFLVLSLVMLALFCFVTKYFHYKLKRTIEETNQIYSMVDQIYQQSEEDADGEFEEFKGKMQADRAKPRNSEDQMYIEMTDLKAPLKNNQDDLYKPSVLRAKLNGQSFQPISKQESNRDISSLKSFRPQKMNTTNRTSRSNKQGESGLTKHTFINKLVCYNSQGLTVCEINVKMIRKVSEGVIKENKTCKVQTFSNSQQGFEDQLESMGFDWNNYGSYKYETSVEVTNMKNDENYLVKSLKTSEGKQQISEEEYYRHFNELTPTKLNS